VRTLSQKHLGLLDHHIGYNSVSLGDESQILVAKWEFAGSANFMVSFKLVADQPLLPKQSKQTIVTKILAF